MKDERPYLVKFEDAQGREHTWVDEYDENGLPALYVDGKGEGQVFSKKGFLYLCIKNSNLCF